VATRTKREGDAFEYRLEIVHVDRQGADGDDLAALDALGAEGWEAVGFAPSTASGRGLHVETSSYVTLLKRRRR